MDKTLLFECDRIIKKIISFTKMMPKNSSISYKEYLARAAELYKIDKRLCSLLNDEYEYDEYCKCLLDEIEVRVDKILNLQNSEEVN